MPTSFVDMRVDGSTASATLSRSGVDAELLDLIEPIGSRPSSPLAASTVIVMAHPDDEVVSLGSRLTRLSQATLVHTTDGAPPNGLDARAHGFTNAADYAAARRHEMERAMALSGIPLDHLRELNCPDQGASHMLTKLAIECAALFRELHARRIITHPYEGGHPDHDATAFAVHAAAAVGASAQSRPLLVEMTSYHLGPGGIETGKFLHPSATPFSEHLSRDECATKRAMLACFNSQRETLQYFTDEVEQFRMAPTYDFLSAPHPGLLFYEKFNWGMTGSQWRQLARAALHQLH
ncbi:MAG TPA: PIG-L family deacetylase, partial [Tepidisphaeraceae bacterium]|nr:PIG-L family deacetylase [Tepidisphaeraceae bacterium]